MHRLPDIGVNPDYGLSRKTDYRVRRDNFGDGYEMRSKEAINHISRSYTLSWSRLSKSQVDTLQAFFDARANVEAFLWDQMKGEDIRLVGVSPTDVNHDDYEDYTFSIEVKQDFGMHV